MCAYPGRWFFEHRGGDFNRVANDKDPRCGWEAMQNCASEQSIPAAELHDIWFVARRFPKRIHDQFYRVDHIAFVPIEPRRHQYTVYRCGLGIDNAAEDLQKLREQSRPTPC